MEKTKTSGKVTFQDKSVYIGELENEIPNGYVFYSKHRSLLFFLDKYNITGYDK